MKLSVIAITAWYLLSEPVINAAHLRSVSEVVDDGRTGSNDDENELNTPTAPPTVSPEEVERVIDDLTNEPTPSPEDAAETFASLISVGDITLPSSDLSADQRQAYDLIAGATDFHASPDNSDDVDWPMELFMKDYQLKDLVSSEASCNVECYEEVTLLMMNEYQSRTYNEGSSSRRRLDGTNDDDFDIDAFDSSVMLELVEDDTVTEPWIEFTGGELDCYKAISNALIFGCQYNGESQPGCGNIREVYPMLISDAKLWPGTLYTMESAILREIEDTCDIDCYKDVVEILGREWYILAKLESLVNGQYEYHNLVSYNTISYLNTVYNLLSIQADSFEVEAPTTPPAWVSVFLSTLKLVADFAGPVGDMFEKANSAYKFTYKTVKHCIAASQKIAEYSYKMWKNGLPSHSTSDSVEFQNDAAKLQYFQMAETIRQNYWQLNNATKNHQMVISGDWGKLKAFSDEVLPYTSSMDLGVINDFLVAMSSQFEYQAFEWIFPAKYGVCAEYTLTSGAQSDCKCHAACNHLSPQLNTELGKHTGWRYVMYNLQPGFNQCADKDYFFFCQEGNKKSIPPQVIFSVLNENEYAKSKGYIKDGSWAKAALYGATTMFDNPTAPVVSVGMELPFYRLPTCKTTGTYSCDEMSYKPQRTDFECPESGEYAGISIPECYKWNYYGN